MRILDDIRNFFNWDNRSIIGLLIAGMGFFGVMLFAPDPWVAQLGFDSFRAEYPWVPGVGLLLSASVLVGRLILTLVDWVKKDIQRRKRWRWQRWKLHDLSPAERDLLRRYMVQDTVTQFLRQQDGVRAELEMFGLIHRAANLGDMGRGFAYNIVPYVREYLRKHPELVS
jgi:hypothetical protein